MIGTWWREWCTIILYLSLPLPNLHKWWWVIDISLLFIHRRPMWHQLLIQYGIGRHQDQVHALRTRRISGATETSQVRCVLLELYEIMQWHLIFWAWSGWVVHHMEWNSNTGWVSWVLANGRCFTECMVVTMGQCDAIKSQLLHFYDFHESWSCA